jgi:hypothetical protein
MSFPLVLITTLCYIGVAVSQVSKGDYPMALVWTGYTVGNLGFMWMFLR